MKTFGTILLIVGGLIVASGVGLLCRSWSDGSAGMTEVSSMKEVWGTQGFYMKVITNELLTIIAGLLVCILGALLRIPTAQRPSITSTS